MSNVPKLRFKDDNGEDYPEWVITTLSNMFTIKAAGDLNKAYFAKNLDNEHPFPVYANSIVNKGLYGYYKMPTYKRNKLTVTARGELGYASAKDHDFTAVGRLLVLDPKPETNIFFFEQLINGKLKIFNEVTGVPQLTAPSLGTYNVSKPTLPEQTKIADFFTLIDKKIIRQDEKVTALEEYKKGLMQKIFSREIRFKDDTGKDYPEWDIKLFGDIFSFYPTYSYSRAMLNMNAGTIKYIHYGDIHTKYPITLDVQNTQIPRLNNTIPSKAISSSSYCKEGDLIIADASEDYEAIGKATVLRNVGNDRIISGLHTILARDEQNLIEHSFRGYLFASEGVKKQIRFSSVGAKVLGISKTNLSKINIHLPTIPEQTKVATFLTLFDRKIEKEKEKLGALQEQKKGLLQQMFV